MLKKLYKVFQSEARPVRFIAARLLVRSRLCSFLKIRRNGYSIRFFPTALSQTLWVTPHDREGSEAFLADYLRPGDRVIDIGANVGTIALRCAAVVGDTGQVYAIEPHPRIFGYLERNRVLNRFDNVTTSNVALGDDFGWVHFSDHSSDDVNFVLQSSTGLTVPLRRLDDLAIEPGRVRLLKIDVEGYELFVFRGARRVLCSTDCVFFESSEEHANRFSHSSRDVIEVLRESGFEVYSILPERRICVVSRTHTSQRRSNLVAIRDVQDFCKRTGYHQEPTSKLTEAA